MNKNSRRGSACKTTGFLFSAKTFSCAAMLLICCLYPLVTQAQKPQPSPTPRRPLPKLSNGARGFDVRKEKDAASRLIAVGGGWGAGEEPRKPRLKQKSAVGYYKLGRKYLERLEFFKAIAPLEKAVKLNPNYLAAYSALGEAYSYYGVTADEEKLRGTPTDEADASVARLRDARYRKAITAFEQARRLGAKNPEFHLNLGVLYFNTGQYQKAVDSLEQGLHLKSPRQEFNIPILESSALPFVYGVIGNAYEYLGENKKAIDAYRNAIAADPESPDESVYLMLAELHEKLGQVDEAIKIYERMLSNTTAKDPERIYDHGKELMRLGSLYAMKQDYATAELAFNTAVRLFDRELNRYKAWLAEADADGRQSLTDEVAHQQTLLAQAYYNAGVSQLSANQPAKASDSFKRVIELEPVNTNAVFNLGYAYLALGNKDAAREEARILKTLDAALANELLELVER